MTLVRGGCVLPGLAVGLRSSCLHCALPHGGARRLSVVRRSTRLQIEALATPNVRCIKFSHWLLIPLANPRPQLLALILRARG